ncbi:uncharacterized protein [Salminus brasiliensis]|uniref:uncharacterized protein n=1 Tax=Salminus brasiliensis TaxID=930266 RepID=UPI003B82CED6
MKIAELHLCLMVICWQQASGLTDMLVDLGQNVSLTCDLTPVKEVYWFIQKYPSPPKPIMRSFFGRAPPYFYDDSFRGKFSLQENSRLVVQSVTKEELGTLYCVETGNLNFSSGTRLYISEPTSPSPHPTQVTDQRTHCETPLLVTVSAALCCVVLAVVFFSGLMCVSGCRKRHPEDEGGDEIAVILQKGGQNTSNTSNTSRSSRSSTSTVVQFTQLRPAL